MINDNLQQQAFALFQELLHGHERSAQLSDYVYVNPERKLSKGEKARCIDMSKLSTTGAFPSGWEYHPYNGGMKFTNGDTILARITPCLENGKRACKIVCVNGKCYCKEGDTADDQEKHKGKGCHRPDTRPAGPAWDDAGGAVWCRGTGEEAYSPAAEQGA